MFAIGGCCLCIAGIPFGILTNFNPKYFGAAMGVVVISLVPVIIGYIVIVRKTPPFDDVFLIHWESRVHSKLLLFLGSIYFACNLAVGAFASVPHFQELMAILLSAIAYVSSFVVCRKNKGVVRDATGRMSVVCQSPSSGSASTSSAVRCTVQMIVSEKRSLNAFMNHLSREYVFAL